jgi:uncharacterized protein YjiK
MRYYALVISALFSSLAITAQPPQVFDFTIGNVSLPADMNKQVCISGMKFYDGKLYFASERCPAIFVFDPATTTVVKTININVPQEFEMEGLTSYRDKFYLVSENVAAMYEVDISNGALKQISTSQPLPPKSKSGDGMEGIAANEKSNKFYLLRERNDDMTQSQIFTYSVEPGTEDNSFSLKYESTIELPLISPQWRYSDICYDKENDRLICLKSFSKGKLRQQFIESIDIDKQGNLQKETLKNIPVENFSEISNQYKDQDYSMNLEGVTIDASGAIYIISDNTSGKAQCEMIAKEKTILLHLKKK